MRTFMYTFELREKGIKFKMSKLFNEFEKKKKENPNKLYLFKSGIFYIGLNEDAEKLSEIFDFKITNLNNTVQKSGFPEKKLEFYTKLLNTCSIDYEIVDLNYGKIENNQNYLDEKKAQDIFNSIKKLDMNKISFKEAFEFLTKVNEQLKNSNLSKEE